MKNVSYGLISRWDMAKGIIFELEDNSTETYKTKKQSEQRLKKSNKNP